MIETKTEHKYYFYGRWLSGFGPSMDPHRCGDPEQPCIVTKWEREISEWRVVSQEMTQEIADE